MKSLLRLNDEVSRLSKRITQLEKGFNLLQETFYKEIHSRDGGAAEQVLELLQQQRDAKEGKP